jgi:hypothetical protein
MPVLKETKDRQRSVRVPAMHDSGWLTCARMYRNRFRRPPFPVTCGGVPEAVMSLRSGVNGRRDSVMWRSRRRVANAGGTAAGQVDDPHRARCESLANRIVAGLLLPRRRAFRDQDILLLAAAIRTVGRDDWGEPADPAAHCGATAAWSRAAKIASRGSQSRCVRSRQDLRRRAAAIGDTPLNHGSGGCAPWHVAEPWVGPPRSVTRRWTMGRAAALRDAPLNRGSGGCAAVARR